MGTACSVARAAWSSLVLAGLSCCSRQQFARVGDLPLVSGATLHDCRIGYRTFGRLDGTRSNAILFPTWMAGSSAQLARHVGPGRMLDSDRFFVVAVDALGDGVSSSPSNSATQPGGSFPTFTIRDLVESQRRLVTRELRLDRLKAVVGISLGGMQALEWATSHPIPVEKVVAIAASPRPAPSDLAFWGPGARRAGPETARERIVRALSRVAHLDGLLDAPPDPLDHRRQIQALLAHDISAPLGGSMERAAAAIRAQMLIVVSEHDEAVNPAPALELARLTHAQVVTLDGRCGHQATRCEREVMWSAVRQFLAQ